MKCEQKKNEVVDGEKLLMPASRWTMLHGQAKNQHYPQQQRSFLVASECTLQYKKKVDTQIWNQLSDQRSHMFPCKINLSVCLL